MGQKPPSDDFFNSTLELRMQGVRYGWEAQIKSHRISHIRKRQARPAHSRAPEDTILMIEF
jgi:hypothetical protein